MLATCAKDRADMVKDGKVVVPASLLNRLSIHAARGGRGVGVLSYPEHCHLETLPRLH